MSAAGEPEPTRREHDCVVWGARGTVGLMVLEMGSWMRRIRSGDGRPPAALMTALFAEDWEAVKREWDRWVWPQLRDEHYQAVRWQTTADTMIATTSEALHGQGGSGPPRDLLKAQEAGDAREVAHEWIRWMMHAISDVTNKQINDEWAAYAETLPLDVREMASEHPVKQAELAATGFEVMALHADLLSAPPPEETRDEQEGRDGECGEPRG